VSGWGSSWGDGWGDSWSLAAAKEPIRSVIVSLRSSGAQATTRSTTAVANVRVKGAGGRPFRLIKGNS